MSRIVTSNAEIEKIAPPALPQATNEYSRAYQDQINNVLRLYFNRVQSILGQLDADGGIIPGLTVYTVATLPDPAVSGAGARAFVSDATSATFGAFASGGGTQRVPVYSNGVFWSIG
jgi:hypothetical protein